MADYQGWIVRKERARIRSRRIIDQLAELVAEGHSVAAASRQVGVCQQYGSRVWADIRAGLGWQAV